jgi:hypothetical protein
MVKPWLYYCCLKNIFAKNNNNYKQIKKMKRVTILPKLVIGLAILSFNLLDGCKKDTATTTTPSNDEVQTESRDIAQSEDVNNDIDNSVSEAMVEHGSGSLAERSDPSNSELSCASVVRDSVAHTVTITYNHCMGPHGHVRDGQIIITYQNGGYWDVGASWDVAFNNFYIDDMQVTGTRHVANVGPASNGMTWNINASLTFTNTSNGNSRSWASTRTRTITQGYGDTIPSHHIYVINGTATQSNNQNGHSVAITMTNLTRDLSCQYITAGTLNCHPNDGRPDRLIDFGNGTCDDVATVTINSNTFTIHLHGEMHH